MVRTTRVPFEWAALMIEVSRELVQPDHPVDDFASARHHDDPDVVVRAQPARERQAVLARQVEIEQDEVRRAGGKRRAHLAAVRRQQDLVALPGKIVFRRLADHRVVVDDQYPLRHGGHDTRGGQGAHKGSPRVLVERRGASYRRRPRRI